MELFVILCNNLICNFEESRAIHTEYKKSCSRSIAAAGTSFDAMVWDMSVVNTTREARAHMTSKPMKEVMYDVHRASSRWYED